jgi:hypothetical protein
METFLTIAFLLCVVVGFMKGRQADPKSTVAGRWGIKTGRFLSGNWGGEKWGENTRDNTD